jgi:hypothetical protein
MPAQKPGDRDKPPLSPLQFEGASAAAGAAIAAIGAPGIAMAIKESNA